MLYASYLKRRITMTKYTHSNIIIDPNKEGIEKLIGKEVYAGDIPGYCLEHAKEGDSYYLGTLIEIRKYDTCPFLVKHDGQNEVFSCIIEKKEEPKPKYIPFENVTEFLDAYRNTPGCLNEEDYFLSNHGIWLKAKYADDALFMVTEIWCYGVVFSCDMKTTEELEGEYLTINQVTTWKELFRDYCFLDGSPCGKESKDV